MSTTIEQLQRIVTDENRSTEDRKQAAEHILKLQESNQAAPAESDEEQVRRIFANILGLDRAEERKRQEDQNMQVCASCFLIQPRTNTSCELCGGSEKWLVPSEVKSNLEWNMFLNMAADYSVEELKTALCSGWATTPQRESFARRLLELREAKRYPQHESDIQTAPNDSPRTLNGIDLGLVATGYDRALAEIDAKLEAFEHRSSGAAHHGRVSHVNMGQFVPVRGEK